MQTGANITRIMYEMCEDNYKDGVRYLEVRFSPLLHLREGLSLSSVISSAVNGAIKAMRKFNIIVRIIICGMRNMNSSASKSMAEATWRFRDQLVCGFDLAGPEDGFLPEDHSEAFSIIRQNCLNCTVHAGEASGAESIWNAIKTCGAQRIGHGVRAYEDPKLVAYILNNRIPLEMCPTSNIQTKAVRSIEEHPIAKYLRMGICVVPCTDNTTVSNIKLSGEYDLIQRSFNMTPQEIVRMIDNGLRSAFLDFKTKSIMRLEMINEACKIIKDDMGITISLPTTLNRDYTALGALMFPKLANNISPTPPKANGYLSMLTEEFFKKLPKSDTHLRLDGSAHPDTYLKILSDDPKLLSNTSIILDLPEVEKEELSKWNGFNGEVGLTLNIDDKSVAPIVSELTSPRKDEEKEIDGALDYNIKPGIVINSRSKFYSILSESSFIETSETLLKKNTAKLLMSSAVQTKKSLKMVINDILESANIDNIMYFELCINPLIHTHHYDPKQRMTAKEVVDYSRHYISKILAKINEDRLKKGETCMYCSIILYISIRENDPVSSYKVAKMCVNLIDKHNVKSDSSRCLSSPSQDLEFLSTEEKRAAKNPILDTYFTPEVPVVGFGIFGGDVFQESINSYQATIKLLRDNLVPVCCSAGREEPHAVMKALLEIGATRISSPYTIHESPTITEYLATNRIPVELAPTEHFWRYTNHTSTFTPTLIRLYHDLGVSISMCSLARTLHSAYTPYKLSRIYSDTAREARLTLEDALVFLANGFRASFLPRHIIREILNNFWDRINEALESMGINEVSSNVWQDYKV